MPTSKKKTKKKNIRKTDKWKRNKELTKESKRLSGNSNTYKKMLDKISKGTIDNNNILKSFEEFIKEDFNGRKKHKKHKTLEKAI